jgi:dTDP-glucose pyrophosphorylase
MQCRDQSTVELAEKVTAFKRNLKLWTRMMKKKLLPFQHCLYLENDHSTFVGTQGIIMQHSEKLKSEFKSYVPNNAFRCSWVRNPFNVDVQELPEDNANIPTIQEKLTETQVKTNLATISKWNYV